MLAFIACTQTQLSHTDTVQLVVESFYQKENTKLKKHTTPESYTAFTAIQDMMTANETRASNFSVIKETVDGDTAWVKFTTSYEEKPETFKLVKVDGQWLITEKGMEEKAPF